MQKVVTLQLNGSNPITTFWKNKKRYAYLVSENVGNFQPSKDSIVVLTHIAWATIVTSAQMVSYDLHLRRGIVGSRFLLLQISPQSQWRKLI